MPKIENLNEAKHLLKDHIYATHVKPIEEWRPDGKLIQPAVNLETVKSWQLGFSDWVQELPYGWVLEWLATEPEFNFVYLVLKQTGRLIDITPRGTERSLDCNLRAVELDDIPPELWDEKHHVQRQLLRLRRAIEAHDRNLVISLLQEEKEIVNKLDCQNYIVLEYAIKTANIATIRILLQNGANINGILRGNAGGSPLLLAVSTCSLQTILYLLIKGADVNYREPTLGFTPLYMATDARRWGVYWLLRLFGARE
jgi:ankyrin repeat protein